MGTSQGDSPLVPQNNNSTGSRPNLGTTIEDLPSIQGQSTKPSTSARRIAFGTRTNEMKNRKTRKEGLSNVFDSVRKKRNNLLTEFVFKMYQAERKKFLGIDSQKGSDRQWKHESRRVGECNRCQTVLNMNNNFNPNW